MIPSIPIIVALIYLYILKSLKLNFWEALEINKHNPSGNVSNGQLELNPSPLPNAFNYKSPV